MPSFRDQLEDVLVKLPRVMAELPLYIRTEEEGFQILEVNRVQKDLHAHRLERGFNAYDDILKARKHGITTYKALEYLTFALFVEGYSAGIAVHDQTTSTRVFKILRWAYDRLPPEMKEEKKLNEDRRDAIEINGSTVYVYTAGSKGMARSETFHSAHGTEVAFWADPYESIPGFTEAVPRYGAVTFESTPNGRAGRGAWWYEHCQATLQGQNSYRMNWYPWWWGDENALPLNPDEILIPTEEELDVIAAAKKNGFDLSLENLKWRRHKILDLGEKFFQEHPEDEETCFLVSGSPMVDPNLLRRLVQKSDSAFVMFSDKTKGLGDDITWRRPSSVNPYIVAVDVSEGLPHGDWSVINVWQNQPDGIRNDRRITVKETTDELAVHVVNIAKEYNNALVIIERNSIGLSVVRKVEAQGYWNQYRQLDRDGEETDHLGWHTNASSKKLMLEEFADGVHQGEIMSEDRDLWLQTMNLVRDEFGKPITPTKKHDDILMSAAMANMARGQATMAGNALSASYA